MLASLTDLWLRGPPSSKHQVLELGMLLDDIWTLGSGCACLGWEFETQMSQLVTTSDFVLSGNLDLVQVLLARLVAEPGTHPL